MIETTNLKLGLNEPDDKCNWFTPTNDNMKKIDTFAGDSMQYQETNDIDKKDLQRQIDSLINTSTIANREIEVIKNDINSMQQDINFYQKQIELIHHDVIETNAKVEEVQNRYTEVTGELAILSTTVSVTVSEVKKLEQNVSVLSEDLDGQKEIVDNLQTDVDGYSQAISDANEAAKEAKGANETVDYSEAVTSLTVDITSLNYPATAVLLVDLYAPPSVNGKITNITTTELDGNYTSVTADVEFTTPPEDGASVTLLVRRA